MTSLETAVTIELGAAIAKSILKLWLKDSTVSQDISSSLIDLLKYRTSDILAQHRGHRQLETIGEKVGESLLPVFEIEGARLDEGSRIEVAREVARAFSTSKLSSKLLAERNLEPTKLARYVIDAHPYPQTFLSFGEAETALYQRIIEESCVCIVDIASQLPAFTEHTFSEILKREGMLITRTDQILQEIRRVREQLNPRAEAGRFEIDYRLAVARNLDELQLVGADVSSANRRHRLSIAYITLSVEQKLSSHVDRYSTLTATVAPLEGPQEESSRDIVSVDKALKSSRRLLIRGPAGSGKTTLLQWIAVRSATNSFEGYLSDWNASIPFFIRLRQCVQPGLPRPEAIPGLVAPAIADTMPKGWVHASLKSGRAILLIDGVDEVPATQREDLLIWLKELLETYPQARFIITSRPHALDEGWMDHEEFSNADLQAMELSDIYSFIDHWHKAVREELQDDEERAELEPLAEHLKEDVKRNRSVRNLATNPLLCAMLCALNRDRRRQLPTDRVELYEACCYLLLERRDKERRIELSDYPALNYRQKRLLLEDLAYWMIKNEWSEVALQLVEERFARKLKEMQGTPQDVSGSGMRRLFVERAGIIREPVVGQVDFAHRTFQEFLAAKASCDEMDTGLLVKNGHNDQWREVIILASGLATKQMREELIKGLIARGDAEKKKRYQLHLLAVACLETSIELGQEVEVEVEKRLSQLVPPKNMADARALAAAGELAVKYLAKRDKEKQPASTIAACVRALALIGSDAALDMLEGYTDDMRSRVINEFLMAWDSFDRETYARRILSQVLRNTSDLYLERLPSLDGVQYLTNLYSLDLSRDDSVRDLGLLAGLTQLAELDLSGCGQISDLSPLTGLTQLRRLNLSGCIQITDLSPLAGMTKLEELNLLGCERVRTLDLTGLTDLASLNLSGCTQLSALSLTGLTRLRRLDLFHCSQLSSLSLIDLAQLPRLDLSSCAQLSTLDLTGLTQLTSLTLSGCSRLSTLNLTGSTQLNTLNLSGCSRLSTLNLTGSTQLTSLTLSSCAQLSTLSLTGLMQLTWLDLSHCHQISKLRLKDLTQLTSLDLSRCSQLSDLNSLTGLNNLEELILYDIPRKLTLPQSIDRKKVRVLES